MEIGGVGHSHTRREQDNESGRCPACLGLELASNSKGQDVNGTVCKRCDGFQWLVKLKVENIPFDENLKNSPQSIFDANFSNKWKEGDFDFLRERENIGDLKNLQSEDFNDLIDPENQSFAKRLLKSLFGLLTLFLLLLFLYLGFSKLRKKPDLALPAIESKPKAKPVDKSSKKSPKGTVYDYDPAIKYEMYSKMTLDKVKSNKGLQNFIARKIKKGKLKQNQKLMSEKGVFHLCHSFGKHSLDCRDKWFRDKKARQAFVERISDLYKKNGESFLD